MLGLDRGAGTGRAGFPFDTGNVGSFGPSPTSNGTITPLRWTSTEWKLQGAGFQCRLRWRELCVTRIRSNLTRGTRLCIAPP